MDELEWSTEGLAASVSAHLNQSAGTGADRRWRDRVDRMIVLDPVSSAEAVAAANMAARLAAGVTSRASLKLVSDTYRDVDRTTHPTQRFRRHAHQPGTGAPWKPPTEPVVMENDDPPEPA